MNVLPLEGEMETAHVYIDPAILKYQMKQTP